MEANLEKVNREDWFGLPFESKAVERNYRDGNCGQQRENPITPEIMAGVRTLLLDHPVDEAKTIAWERWKVSGYVVDCVIQGAMAMVDDAERIRNGLAGKLRAELARNPQASVEELVDKFQLPRDQVARAVKRVRKEL